MCIRDRFFVKYFNDFLSREPESQMELLAECPDFLVSYIRPIIKSSSLNATKAKSYHPISVSHTLVVLIERLICDSFLVPRHLIIFSDILRSVVVTLL